MNASHDDRTALLATIDRRLSSASKPGRRDEAAFEAARILEAIEEHTAEPRDFSAAFIGRQWNRLATLMAAA